MFKWVNKLIKKQHKLSKLEELFLREFDKGVEEKYPNAWLYKVGDLTVNAVPGFSTVSVFHDSYYLGELASEYGDKVRDFVQNEKAKKREERIQKLLKEKE